MVEELLASPSSFRVLLIGDFLFDIYTTGKVKRISPEAPVPVMEVLKKEMRPGGAGNVALSLRALGGEVITMGRLGENREGALLQESLEQAGVDTSALLVEEGYQTPVKNRLIADSQQLLRVDQERVSPLKEELELSVIAQLATLIPKVEVVALSDYGKGYLTPPLIQASMQMAKQANVPVIVDPKGIDFTKYRGATILKPNLSEAYAAAKLPFNIPLDEVAREIFNHSVVDLLLITRSEQGMSLFNGQGVRSDFPVRSKEVKDVTGAGDTVLAALCFALAQGLEIQRAVHLANTAAGIAIERVGCAQITLSELALRFHREKNSLAEI